MRYWRRYCGCLCTIIKLNNYYYRTVVPCKLAENLNEFTFMHNHGATWIRNKTDFIKVKEKDLTSEEIRAIMLLKFQGEI